MAYINPNITEADFNNLDDWGTYTQNGSVVEIDPAGQVHFDVTSITVNNSYSFIYRDAGTIGTGDYYVEFRFKGDTWDDGGIYYEIQGGTNKIQGYFGNTLIVGSGITVNNGTEYLNVYNTTWDNNWHTVVFYVHNSQTDMDIWVDKDPATEAADVTDADVSITKTTTDGHVGIAGYGTIAGNGEYHIDYYYVGDALPISETVSIPTAKLVANGLTAVINATETLATVSVETAKLVAKGLTTTIKSTSDISIATAKLILNGLTASGNALSNISVGTAKLVVNGLTSTIQSTANIATSLGKLVIKPLTITLRAINGWIYADKHTTTFTGETKHTTTQTNETKNTTTWTNETKHKEGQ